MNIKSSFMVILFMSYGAVSMTVATFDDLSHRIIELSINQKSDSMISEYKEPLLKKLEKLSQASKNIDNSDSEVFSTLMRIVDRDDNQHISFESLVMLLRAAQEKLATNMHDGIHEKLPELLSAIVSGKKNIVNVLLIGRTRSGKSTFLANLIDPLNVDLSRQISLESIFSHTVDCKHYIAIFNSHEDGLFAARIIDTPGLSEVKPCDSVTNARTDDEIIADIIQNCAGLRIDKALQIFPLPTSGFNPQDFSAFAKLKNGFKDQERSIDIVFSGADKVDNPEEIALQSVSKFEVHGLESPEQILVTGAIFNHYFGRNDESATIASADNVLRYRTEVLGWIFGVNFMEYLSMVNENENIVEIASTAKDRIIQLIGAKRAVNQL